MRISIASDHAGYAQKAALVDYLEEKGHTVIDHGPANEDRVDYPDYALPVASDVATGSADRGILVCGTGIGMAICANKVAGVRAACCINTDQADLSRQHNDANVLTLSGRFVDLASNEEIVDLFLDTGFAGGRHADRLAKIAAIERGD
jgi:ribose 5-phosphate isomerase B